MPRARSGVRVMTAVARCAGTDGGDSFMKRSWDSIGLAAVMIERNMVSMGPRRSATAKTAKVGMKQPRIRRVIGGRRLFSARHPSLWRMPRPSRG